MAGYRNPAVDRVNDEMHLAERTSTNIVQNAYRTPEGKALIDHLQEMFGNPGIPDNTLKAYAELGAFKVTLYLQQQILKETL